MLDNRVAFYTTVNMNAPIAYQYISFAKLSIPRVCYINKVSIVLYKAEIHNGDRIPESRYERVEIGDENILGGRKYVQQGFCSRISDVQLFRSCDGLLEEKASCAPTE